MCDVVLPAPAPRVPELQVLIPGLEQALCSRISDIEETLGIAISFLLDSILGPNICREVAMLVFRKVVCCACGLPAYLMTWGDGSKGTE